MTISVPEDVAVYLRSTAGVSSTIAEAVGEYRARELESKLEAAYRSDAEESAKLNEEWESADSDVGD